RISALLDLLGSPQRAYPSIHVAGTNGKTSVARMIDALVTALHRRTGRTTSPHLQSAVERISIDAKPISPARYVDTYREIEPFVQMVDQQSQAAGGPAMSKFEVLTAMAFAAFADAPVDVAVVEVGMGGRWDATNVVNAPVAVITPISIDHVDYLGHDLAGIAGEKAGIITRAPAGAPDTVAVIAQQPPEVMEVLLAQCVQADAAVARAGSEFAVLGRQVAIGGQLLQLQGLGGVYSDVYLPLHGEHQAHNAALALAAVEAFFGAGAQRQLDVDAVRAGFAAVTSPGRLERMRSAPTVFIDAAHNPAGAAALARTLADEFDFRFLVGVLSVLADKDVDGILAALQPVFHSVVVTHNGSPRALDVESLALAAREQFGPDRVSTAENLSDAIDVATALVDDAVRDGLVDGQAEDFAGTGIVITGSVVTAGAARTLFGRDLAVGARDVDGRVGALRRAQQVQQCADPGQAGLDLGLRPALVQQVFDLQQRGDLVRGGDRVGNVVLRRPVGRLGHCSTASRALIRSLSSCASRCRSRILSTTCGGALARKSSLASLAVVDASSLWAAARSFSSRRRSAATSMLPEVSSSTTTVPPRSRTSTDADGRKSGPASVSQASEVTALTWVSRSDSVTPASRAGTFCRSASPWSLRNRRTSVTSFCMSVIRCVAT
ncbi:dihydrofolate synthase, partial [Mycobacterium avium 11-0986]